MAVRSRQGRTLTTGDYAQQVDADIAEQVAELQDEADTYPYTIHDPATGEPLMTQRAPRLRGRAVPPPPEPEDTALDIIINEVHLGTIYPEELTIGAQLDLEDAKSIRHLINWLVKHADADAEQVEAVLRPLPLGEMLAVGQDIGAALGRSIALSKKSSSSSPSPTKTTTARNRSRRS